MSVCARRATRAALATLGLRGLLLLGLAGCGARAPRELVIEPDAPVVTVERRPEAREHALDDDAVARDLAIVLDVLDSEYAGRAFVTRETLASFRRALGEITRRSHTAGSLCDALGSALTSLIDPGLYVSSDVDAAGRCRGEEAAAGCRARTAHLDALRRGGGRGHRA